MKSTSLYNLDGSLSPEAQQLLSHRPDGVSIADWRKTLKKFRDQLSPEDLKEFERLRKKKRDAKRRAENPEKVKTENAKWRAKNPDYNAKWYAENPDYNANWYDKNAEKVKQDNAKWRVENLDYQAIWRAENPDYSANWYDKNAEKVKQDNARWSAEKRAKDPLFRLQNSMRSACTRVVKQLSLGKKPTSTFKWIGCSPEELKSHLEYLFTEGMTWENYGEWHVDHIRPVCSFFPEEWEQVNHYTNLRPLWAEDNLTKSGFDRRQSVRKSL